MEVDRLRAVGEKLVASEQLSEEDQASVENQMVSLGSHWNRIMNDSGTKTEALAAALLTVNHVYDELKNFKEFILDAEDTLACADTIGGKNSDELQDLMAAVSERQPAFDELLTGGDDLVTADTEIAASSALKLELYQVESRWKSIKVRLAKWAKQLGLDKVKSVTVLIVLYVDNILSARLNALCVGCYRYPVFMFLLVCGGGGGEEGKGRRKNG